MFDYFQIKSTKITSTELIFFGNKNIFNQFQILLILFNPKSA